MENVHISAEMIRSADRLHGLETSCFLLCLNPLIVTRASRPCWQLWPEKCPQIRSFFSLGLKHGRDARVTTKGLRQSSCFPVEFFTTVRDLGVQELIPIPGHPQAGMLKYGKMRLLEWNGVQDYIEADVRSGEIITVNVRQALDGVRGRARHQQDNEQRPRGDIFVNGDYIQGEKMRDKNSINVGGNAYNLQISPRVINTTNIINEQPAGEKRSVMEQLQRHVDELIHELPPEKQGDAKKIAGKLKIILEQSAEAEPDRGLFDVSAKGILEAAGFVGNLTTKIAPTLLSLGKLALGTGYLLPA